MQFGIKKTSYLNKIINTCDVLTYNEKFANDNKILQVQH